MHACHTMSENTIEGRFQTEVSDWFQTGIRLVSDWYQTGGRTDKGGGVGQGGRLG